jgi:hypothetical protein
MPDRRDDQKTNASEERMEDRSEVGDLVHPAQPAGDPRLSAPARHADGIDVGVVGRVLAEVREPADDVAAEAHRYMMIPFLQASWRKKNGGPRAGESGGGSVGSPLNASRASCTSASSRDLRCGDRVAGRRNRRARSGLAGKARASLPLTDQESAGRNSSDRADVFAALHA